jgi:hypothetical protein
MNLRMLCLRPSFETRLSGAPQDEVVTVGRLFDHRAAAALR